MMENSPHPRDEKTYPLSRLYRERVSIHTEDPIVVAHVSNPPVTTQPKDPFFDDSEVTAPKGREDPPSVTPFPRKNSVNVEDPTATPRLSSPPAHVTTHLPHQFTMKIRPLFLRRLNFKHLLEPFILKIRPLSLRRLDSKQLPKQSIVKIGVLPLVNHRTLKAKRDQSGLRWSLQQ